MQTTYQVGDDVESVFLRKRQGSRPESTNTNVGNLFHFVEVVQGVEKIEIIKILPK